MAALVSATVAAQAVAAATSATGASEAEFATAPSSSPEPAPLAATTGRAVPPREDFDVTIQEPANGRPQREKPEIVTSVPAGEDVATDSLRPVLASSPPRLTASDKEAIQHRDLQSLSSTTLAIPPIVRSDAKNAGISSLDDASISDEPHPKLEELDVQSLSAPSTVMNPSALKRPTNLRTLTSCPKTEQGAAGRSALPRARPVLQRYYSMPMHPLSPARHRFRLHNAGPHHVKETGNVAKIEDARGQFINQYQITRVVGRGSFGMVYLAVDPQGQQYALKECSKARLAKLNRAALMKLRRQFVSLGGKVPPPAHNADIASLITREVAVMKKIDHPSLVTLYEVLDSPSSESLFLVLEWCPNGTIMPPEEEYDGKATPIPEDQCRLYFRDLLLGVEYLHARGICHRDIKADNVLLGDDDVVKLTDFGVSEIFDLAAGDTIQRPVGSPAYMSPELVALNYHGEETEALGPLLKAPISGRKADLWAMGVTLFYMYHGHLPFEASDFSTLHLKILTGEPEIAPDCPPELADVFKRMLERDPQKRITLQELRVHPWVTRNGSDMLMSTEENVQESDDDRITEEDLMYAIELIEREQHVPMDYLSVSRGLRIAHGWHGYEDSESSSGSHTPRRLDSIDSQSSQNLSPPPPPSAAGGKMDKLSRAIEELLKLNWWTQSNDAKT